MLLTECQRFCIICQYEICLWE